MKTQALLDAMNIATTPKYVTFKRSGYSASAAAVITLTSGGVDYPLLYDQEVIVPSGAITASFSIPGSEVADYAPQYRVYDEDEQVVATGYLDGTPVTIPEGGSVDFYADFYVDSVDTVFNGPESDRSIFGFLASIFDASFIQPDQMTVDYLLNHSGNKAASPLVMAYAHKYGTEDNDGKTLVLNQASLEALAKIIWARYGDSWDKIYNALVEEYAPLENYSMVEEETPNLTETRGVTDDYKRSVHTEQASKVTSKNLGTDTDASVYGFNSATKVPESNTYTEGETSAEGSADDNYTDTEETQTGAQTVQHTGNRRLTRAGNIGVTTSQQMLESEVALRISRHMEDIVYQDMDKVLTLAFYAPIVSEEIKFI